MIEVVKNSAQMKCAFAHLRLCEKPSNTKRTIFITKIFPKFPTMRLRPFCLLVCLAFFFLPSLAQKKVSRTSPDGRILFSFRMEKGRPQYSVHYDHQLLVEHSGLGFQFDDGGFETGLQAKKPAYRKGEESYSLVVGKAGKVRDQYNELTIPLVRTHPPLRQANLVVRIFNSGLAFRYEFPEQGAENLLTITAEHTRFRINGDPTVKALFLPGYTTSHEGFYTTLPFKTIREHELMDMPALLLYPDSVYMAITEARLLDYAGMYLMRDGNELVSALSPWPSDTAVKVKARLPHQSPWRVLLIGNRWGALMESNIITSLNDPCAITDTRWIRPGKTTFPWWNGNVLPDTINAPGNNFVTQQYYIDFCARNGIEYHSVVEYGLHQWYMDDGVGFQPGPHTDVTTPVPGLDMKKVCDYAHQKGVGIRVWVHWAALYPKLDSAFERFEKWGINGMMVDFMDRDDQQMVNIQTEILQKAAAHHLHIQFHGAYKPTGLSRTYPNEFTREGTLNYENNKWNTGLSPEHDLDIVFTRMLAGPTDYHLGGFRAVAPEKYRIQYTRPLMLGTRCHMLAMYVVLESYLGMVCDYPEAYENEPGFDFIKQVPTTWDESRVLAAVPGKYVVIARRKNRDWYLGGITGREPEAMNIPLDFLGEGRFSARIYSDAENVKDDPNHIGIQSTGAGAKDSLKLRMAGGGGVAVWLQKIE
jgi:alpha-glucosidase